MTTITISRATVEQALEALKDDQYRLVEVGPNQYEYKTDLAIAALERALAQQAEPVQEPATSKDSLQVGQEEPEGGWQSAPSPQVTQRIADMPMSEYRRGVNDGFKLGLREGRIKAEDEMMVGPIEPTRRMIEAGAQRLVSWEDGSVWPDSWDALQVAAARNDAERVWRSMRAEAPKQVPRREWVGLTEEEIIDAVRESDLDWHRGWTLEDGEPNRYTKLARAIEAALKERNT